jgi:replicative DNA helicase
MKNTERELLGKLIHKNDLIFSCKLKPDMFSDNRNRQIFMSAESIASKGQEANILEISRELAGKVDPVYIATLTDGVYSDYGWENLADNIRRSYKKSLLKKLNYEFAGKLDKDPEETINFLMEQIQKITQEDEGSEIVSMSEIMSKQVGKYEERFRMKGEYPGLVSGIDSLDRVFMGFQKSRLYYLCARPSQGKSALMLNAAVNMGISGANVGMISIESSREEIADRAISYYSKIDGRVLTTGMYRASDFHGITEGASALYDTKIFVYDKPNATITDIKQTARRMMIVHDIKILFVDYLQLIRVNEAKDRRETVSTASMELKALARELKIPVVALAQLSRDSDERRPHLGDIQWSSQAEQDADAVLLMQMTDPILDERGNETGITKCHFFIDKNRDGAKGFTMMEFTGKFLTFKESVHQPSAQDMQEKKRGRK